MEITPRCLHVFKEKKSFGVLANHGIHFLAFSSADVLVFERNSNAPRAPVRPSVTSHAAFPATALTLLALLFTSPQSKPALLFSVVSAQRGFGSCTQSEQIQRMVLSCWLSEAASLRFFMWVNRKLEKQINMHVFKERAQKRTSVY